MRVRTPEKLEQVTTARKARKPLYGLVIRLRYREGVVKLIPVALIRSMTKAPSFPGALASSLHPVVRNCTQTF